MNATPRIPPLMRKDWTDEVRRALGPVAEREYVDNVFATMVRHPDLWRRYSPFANHILFKSTLGAREREIAILRIGSLNRAEYEFAQHTFIGIEAGLTQEEVARVHAGPAAPGWNDLDRAILVATDELQASGRISDDTWSALGEHYGTHQMMDLVFTIGAYNLISWGLNSFGVQVDDRLSGYPWPPE